MFRDRWMGILVVLVVVVTIAAGVKVWSKADDGRTAFVRWMADTRSLALGEMIYGTDPEGYPNLPMTALLLVPFHALGPLAGSMMWFLLKVGAIVVILYTVRCMMDLEGRAPPSWFMAVVFLLSARVFVGDLTHGNINLVIGCIVACALLAVRQERDFLAGFLVGFAAILKVTPALFMVYFLYKKRWRTIPGACVAALAFLWLIPGLALGFDRNLELVVAWYQQMISPFLSGAPVGIMQTSHINQSFLGLFHRLFTDAVAIEANVKRGSPEVRVNFMNLDQGQVEVMLRAVYLLILGVIAWFARTPSNDRKNLGNLGEAAMVFLAMLMISERSWKHHYVLIILGHAFVLRYLFLPGIGPSRTRAPWILLGLSMLCHLGSGSFLLGRYISDLAESYGVYLFGALFLFSACAVILRQMKRDEWSIPDGSCQRKPSEVA